MNTPDIDTLRRIVRAKHGGFDEADDSAILRIWNALSAEAQRRYLAEQPQKPKPTTKDARDST